MMMRHLSLAAATLCGSATAAKPMRGWMTWERYTCETDCVNFPDTCISERLIRTIADAMQAEGLVGAGYDYIQIDDCWAAAERDAAGAIVPDPIRFPSGMKALANYVAAKGMKLGLCEFA
jgi:alpha-N-acetylgalactosaminidase